MQGRCQACGQALARGGQCPRCTLATSARRRPSGSGSSSGSGSGAGRALPGAIGPYAVSDLLGRGSFGVVYKVRRGSGPPLALKLLLARGQQDVLRFQGEVEIARRLQHPGLVRVVDAGMLEGPRGGFPYYVMDYCPGETLADRLRRGPLPPQEAAGLVAELARTATQVHAQGVVHRDLKPANVILDHDSGRPRITDFGLAHDAAAGQRLTQTGDQMGTPLYMAPELFKDSKRADQQVDVYALGVILYECLTGRRPFEGRTLAEVVERVRSGAARRPRDVQPEVPSALEAICLRAMACDPGDRYVDAGRLAGELDAFLAQQRAQKGSAPRHAPDTTHGPPKAAFLVAGLLLVASGLVIALALVLRGDPPPDATDAGPVADAPSQLAPGPAPGPAPALPSPARPDLQGAREAIDAGLRAERALAPVEESLAHYARALELAGDDPELSKAAALGELNVLLGRGADDRLRQRAHEVQRTLPAAARGARLLELDVLLPNDPQRLAALRAMAAESQEDGVGLLARVLLDGSEGRGLDADRARRALELDPNLAAAHLVLAVSATRAGRDDDAERELAAARECSPNSPKVLWYTVNLLQQRQRSGEAIPHLERLIALRPSGDPLLFEALYQRARMALHVQRFAEALPFLDRALEERPGDRIALMLRGMIHLRLGDEARAGVDYRDAVLQGLAPFQQVLDQRYRGPQQQAAIWQVTLQALSQASRPEDLARARTVLEGLCGERPDQAQALRVLGLVRLREGDALESVLAPWERAVALDPEGGIPAPWLALLRERHPQFDGADALRGAPR